MKTLIVVGAFLALCAPAHAFDKVSFAQHVIEANQADIARAQASSASDPTPQNTASNDARIQHDNAEIAKAQAYIASH